MVNKGQILRKHRYLSTGIHSLESKLSSLDDSVDIDIQTLLTIRVENLPAVSILSKPTVSKVYNYQLVCKIIHLSFQLLPCAREHG